MQRINDILDEIARASNTTLFYNQRLYVLEVLLRRMSEILLQKESLDFVFRGSLILRNWVSPHRRIVKDLDLLGTIPFDLNACQQLVLSAIELSKKEKDGIVYYSDNLIIKKTWEETESPGLRIFIPFSHLDQNNFIQIDFGFDDSIYPEPMIMVYKNILGTSFKVPTVPIELALAWKVHGLFEFWDKGGGWSSKTLYDIHLILTHLNINKAIFKKVLMTAFEERKTPLSTYSRVLNETFGRSKGSRKSWKKFIKRNGISNVKESQIEIIERHRKFLDPFFTNQN